MAKKKQQKKKVEKKENKEKKNPSNAKYVMVALGLVVLGLLIFFVVRAITAPKNINPIDVIQGTVQNENAYTYGGLPFIKKGDTWTTQIEINGQTYDIQKQYGPKELEDLNITYKLNNFSMMLKRYRTVYITLDPEAKDGSYAATTAASMILALKQVYQVRAITACTVNSSVCAGKEIVTCDTVQKYPVIQFTTNSSTSIVYRDNCLDLRGSGQDIIRAGDKVIYGWYGILE